LRSSILVPDIVAVVAMLELAVVVVVAAMIMIDFRV
jgi:hypothetical protein